MRSEPPLILLLILGAPLNHAGRKGGTHRRRYLNNGYVLGLIQHPGRLSDRHREQAPSHTWIAVHQSYSYKLPGSSSAPKLCRSLCLDEGVSASTSVTEPPPLGANPLPHCIALAVNPDRAAGRAGTPSIPRTTSTKAPPDRRRAVRAHIFPGPCTPWPVAGHPPASKYP